MNSWLARRIVCNTCTILHIHHMNTRATPSRCCVQLHSHTLNSFPCRISSQCVQVGHWTAVAHMCGVRSNVSVVLTWRSAVLSTMTDQLIEIDREKWPILQNLFKSNRSLGYLGYMTIGNYIGFFDQDPNVKHVKIYCLNGEFSDGTFVITVMYFITSCWISPNNLIKYHVRRISGSQ